MTIPQITIHNSQIKEINIPKIWGADGTILHPQVPYVPVTVDIGKPIVDIPGCVEAHELNKTEPGGTKNKQLAKDDETVTFCDAGTPSFNAMDYTPEQLTIQRETPPPPVSPPPEIDPPEIPDTGNVGGKEEVPCPGPAQLRVGDITQSGDERVVGHRLIDNGKTCETLYEPTSPVEKFLPSINQTTTTVAIAVVATAGATATPLLLRVFKPIITKLWKTLQKKIGKKVEPPTRAEIQTNKYREKKGLPPLKKK